jgi:hypothetical protein
MCYHLKILWPDVELRANLQKVHMIFPTLRFSSKKARGQKQMMQTYTLRVNLWNLGVYQKHLTLEWHLVKLAPAGLGLPGGCVFSRSATTPEGCHRSIARRCMRRSRPKPPPPRAGDDISGVFMFSSARLDLWFAILKSFRVQTRRGV